MSVEDVAYACTTRYGGTIVLRVHVRANDDKTAFLGSCMQALLEDGVAPYTVRKLAGVPLQRWKDAWTWGESPPILIREPMHVRVMMSMGQRSMYIPVSPQLQTTPLETFTALHAFMEIHGYEMLDMVNPGCFYTMKRGVIVPLTTRGDLYTYGMWIGKVRPKSACTTFVSLHCSDYEHKEWEEMDRQVLAMQ